MDEAEVWRLKNRIEEESAEARRKGYLPLDVGNALKEAENLLMKYRSTKGWEEGYWGRAENYDLGFDVERESLLLKAVEHLLRAKGALISLKLPRWAKDLRYYYMDVEWGGEGVESMDTHRGVVFMSGREWSLEGFPRTQPLWYRCSCRPTVDGVRLIEKHHAEGRRVGTYMSGGMMAITFALLPDAEENWTDDFMRAYAGHYWHGAKERFWGARDPSSEWNRDLPTPLTFSEWMLSQLEFAQRIGFDFIHLDEAFGRYFEAGKLSERSPNFVVCPNNLARMYIDEENWRFGWTAMGESLGHPSSWDDFHRRMRMRSLRCRNINWWGWHTYTPFDDAYQNLSYATTLANKGTDVSHSNPSPEYVRFSRRFSDYIYGPYVDVYVSQEVAKPISRHESLRIIVNRRALSSGREEIIMHLLNISPEIPFLKNVAIELDCSCFNLKWPPEISFATPEYGVKNLEARVEERKIIIEVAEFKTWGIIVVGEKLFPSVELRLKKRDGVQVLNALDDAFIPGVEIEVEAQAEDFTDYSMFLHLPEGWKYEETNTRQNTRLFKVMPLFAEKNKGYAITPIVSRNGESIPSWPLILQAKDLVCFRLIPPMAESPRVKADYELEVKNYSGRSGTLRFTVKPPEGWEISEKVYETGMEPGETRKIPLSMVTPDYHLHLWDQLDVDIPVDWEFLGLKGSDSLKIRVFPACFHVYSKGVERKIMHSYPNLYFIDDLDEAKQMLKKGRYVALWLVNQDPEEYGPLADEFISMNGGVVWMGEPFSSVNCPVTLEEKNLKSKTISYLNAGKNILKPALRKRSLYESEDGFKACRVKAKDWGETIAIWGRPPEGFSGNIENTPAAILSKDPGRRIVYIGSDLEATSEEKYRFEERNHHETHWYQTYVFYILLNWASGAYKSNQ
ncbi:MAG: hypothetical protein QW506_02725 [Thermoproteota archaeon]